MDINTGCRWHDSPHSVPRCSTGTHRIPVRHAVYKLMGKEYLVVNTPPHIYLVQTHLNNSVAYALNISWQLDGWIGISFHYCLQFLPVVIDLEARKL